MKCNQSGPGFELVSPCLYPATITIHWYFRVYTTYYSYFFILIVKSFSAYLLTLIFRCDILAESSVYLIFCRLVAVVPIYPTQCWLCICIYYFRNAYNFRLDNVIFCLFTQVRLWLTARLRVSMQQTLRHFGSKVTASLSQDISKLQRFKNIFRAMNDPLFLRWKIDLKMLFNTRIILYFFSFLKNIISLFCLLSLSAVLVICNGVCEFSSDWVLCT